MMARHPKLVGSIVAAIIILLIFNAYSPSGVPIHTPNFVPSSATAADSISPDLLNGKAIAPKLGNETLKAELGRAAWRVLHTTFARFPEKPTSDERETLRTYIHLFQKLYPCGECATHFGELLKEFPPQVSSRNAAAGWGCFVHNKVNERLNKPLFDCLKIGDFYDCGCTNDEKDKKEGEGGARARPLGAGAGVKLDSKSTHEASADDG